MGAKHQPKRPKGYVDWKPADHVLTVVEQVKEILSEYGHYGPMTVRQIFYRLVGNYGYDKTELAYKRLCEYLVRARRAQMIRFGAIRDDGGTTKGGPSGYDSLDEFLASMAYWGRDYDRDLTAGQPCRIEVWCEAEGMVPMLAQMVRPYGVRVTGTGGFSSITVTHSIAQSIREREVPTRVLHVGDYDPSGESIFYSMCQDVGRFLVQDLGGEYDPDTGRTLRLDGYYDEDEAPFFLPQRVALTAGQVAEFNLPTAPPKSSDSRSRNWAGETTQAEAMPPDLLEQVVTRAVREYVDFDKRAAIEQEQERERELIGSRVSDAIEQIRRDIRDEDAE